MLSKMQLTDQNFATEVLSFSGIALVDFFAEWCGPCRMMAPVIEEIAQENTNQEVKIGKINVDESPQTASQYGVMSIPTLIFFKNGQEVARMMGAQSKTRLLEQVQQLS
ncbi:thioredoxin [Candidatus Peregrinibacteria bacterium CG1_02_41_10]|nr:MAG: thioredoxin [Candidatus Peregrinibacteria bacterium CG1_02_41_10]